MKIQRFEDIIAWQKSQDVAVHIYTIFKESRDFAFKDQIQRASVSISNNIAEVFLYMSLGSCSEVKSMLYLSERLNYLNSEQTKPLIVQIEEISKILRGLIKSLS